MQQHGNYIGSSLLVSVTAVTVSLMTTASSPEGAKREGSDTTQTQGCESCAHGDADVACVQRKVQTECLIHTACFETGVSQSLRLGKSCLKELKGHQK